jgi:hypothetical protein
VYYTAYRRRKRRDMMREEMGMGNHEMLPPVDGAAGSSPSGTYAATYMQSAGSVSGGGGYGSGGAVHMKVAHAGGGKYHGIGQGQQGQVYERAELPVRGWDEAELSAEGRYLQ